MARKLFFPSKNHLINLQLYLQLINLHKLNTHTAPPGRLAVREMRCGFTSYPITDHLYPSL